MYRGAGTAGASRADAPAALVVRGRMGAEKCLFCKTIHNCICIKTVIHKRRIDEVSAKEMARSLWTSTNSEEYTVDSLSD